MRQPFFFPEDFESLRRSNAQTLSQSVIRARKQVVTHLRDLHQEQIGAFLRKQGLHAHPNPDYWTNVFFPKKEANGEWVDYLRFGYGKEANLVKQMAKSAGTVQTITTYGTQDHMAFHFVAQVQLGLTADYWWFNFYVDDKAWLELANLVNKIQAPTQRHLCVGLLEELQELGYDLRIWSSQEPDVSNHARETAEEFLADLEKYRREHKAVNVDVEKRFDPNDLENDVARMAEVAKREFQALIPLYRFWAWHPTANHHIPKLVLS